MAKVTFTAALRDEYQHLFDQCQITSAKAAEVEQLAARLIANQARYVGVGQPLGIPWHMVAVIHNMECGQNFRQHLHNGDPLTACTVQVPPGRPATGSPPFTWEESAADALVYDRLNRWSDWTIPGMLYCLEGYNGWGYRLAHPEVKSPYLWSGSNHYNSGKYVRDGTWSDTAVSAQVGAAVLLRRIAERGAMQSESHVPDPKLAAAMARSSALLKYAPTKVTPGGLELQKFLNQFPGIFLKEDGKLGDRTSEANYRIFGVYLSGDPRA